MLFRSDPLADLDDYLGQALTDWRVPGLAVAVVKDGRRVLVRGYGVRRTGDSAKVDEQTVFNIASCTKSFTVACVALLCEEGQVHWDDPVVKHLPEFRLYDPIVTREVTLRDLACHRTGLESTRS